MWSSICWHNNILLWENSQQMNAWSRECWMVGPKRKNEKGSDRSPVIIWSLLNSFSFSLCKGPPYYFYFFQKKTLILITWATYKKRKREVAHIVIKKFSFWKIKIMTEAFLSIIKMHASVSSSLLMAHNN